MAKKLSFSLASLVIALLILSAWLVGIGMAAPPLPSGKNGQTLLEELHVLDVDEGLGPEWENAGIYGATSSNAAYDPTTGDVYLATAGAYYKSTDGGQSWGRIVADGHQALAVDQVDGTVYLGLAASKEIWVSTNHGATWTVQSVFGEPHTLALDPANRGVAFLGTGEPSSGGAGRIYRSLDRGETWNPTLVDDGHCISSVAVNPLDQDNVWAVSWGCQGLLDHSAVFSSTDRGLSYSLVLTDSNPFEYYQIMFDSNGLIYLAGDDVRVSANGGITFTEPALVDKLSTYASMAIDPVSDRVYIATIEGGYHCDDGGPWVFDGLPGILSIDPNDTDHMLAVSGQGVQRSTDGGTSWDGANTGLEQVIVAQIAGHAQDASTVYATTHRGSGRSLDGGDSWEFPNTGTSSRGLAVSPITSAIAYMGQDRGAWIYSTTNAGDSWSQTRITDTEGFVRQIAVDPVTPSVVYATVSSLAYDPYADTSWDGLYVSTNSGGTWEDAGLLGRQISCVALGDDQTDVTVYAGEGDFHRGQTTGGLWRLDPGSSVWAYNGPANTIVTHIAVDPRDPMHVYIASNSNFNFTIDMGLLESYDGGDTWDWIYTDTHVSLLELDPQDPDVVYFSDGGGLCRSLDGGETWEEYDRHPSGSFNTLYFNYSGTPTVFAGTGEGIFRRRLGATAQLQPTVSSTLQFTTSRGTTVTVEIPVAAVSETVDLLFMEVPDLTNLEPDQVFAGHGFNLNVFRNDEKAPSYTFQSPVTVTIAYTDTDVIDVDENQLRLLYLDGQEWVDAACGPYLRNPGENWIQVPICHLSLFGLFQYDTATGALYVDDASGNDTGNCQDPAAPCQTIGYAISQAGDGDTLRVAQGTYVENPSVNIGVTLEGGYEAISWTRSITRYDTTIDGSGSTTQSVVTIPAGDVDVVLDGFTITGGNTTGNGGGVLIGSGGTVTITSSVITGNVSGGEGGGVAAYGPLTLMDSIISDNLTQDHGGAVSTQQATVHLINVLITGNETTSGNANVLTVDESDVTIINSTMADNNPQGAQAVLMWSGNLTITNSIMWNNALNLQADPPCPTCFSVTYSDIQGGWSGTGNIDTDPRFVDVASGDYDLSAGSPCIDGGTTAGAPARDIEGTPRDPAPDMGAYEWTGFRIFLPLTLQNVGP